MKKQMLTPPKFSEIYDYNDGFYEKSLEIIQSEDLPISPDSNSTSIKSLFELLEQAIDNVKNHKISIGLKKLQDLLHKVSQNRSMIANIDQNSSEFAYWKIQFVVLYHMIYAYSFLENEPNLLKTNKRLIKLMDSVKKANKESNSFLNTKNKQENNSVLGHKDKQITEKIKIFTKSESLIGENIATTEIASMNNTINFQFLFAKVLLFCCFRLSKIQQHEQACLQAEKAKQLIQQMFYILDNQEYEEEEKEFYVRTTLKNEKIQFKKVIGDKAHQILKQIKKDLEIRQIQQSELLKLIKSTASCWKKNPQHSKKDLKEHKNNCYIDPTQIKVEKGERTLLGVRAANSPTATHISKFSSIPYKSSTPNTTKRKNPQCIKDIINLQPLTCKQIFYCQNMTFERTSDKLKEKLQLLSAAYFCIGIQLWNLQTQAQQAKQHIPHRHQNYLSSHNPLSLALVQQKTKLNSFSSDQDIFVKSQLYLLKSISIVLCYLKQYDDTLLDNLVDVYQRKFEGEMMIIMEENSKYQMSISLEQLRRSHENNMRFSTKLAQKQKLNKIQNAKVKENGQNPPMERDSNAKKSFRQMNSPSNSNSRMSRNIPSPRQTKIKSKSNLKVRNSCKATINVRRKKNEKDEKCSLTSNQSGNLNENTQVMLQEYYKIEQKNKSKSKSKGKSKNKCKSKKPNNFYRCSGSNPYDKQAKQKDELKGRQGEGKKYYYEKTSRYPGYYTQQRKRMPNKSKNSKSTSKSKQKSSCKSISQSKSKSKKLFKKDISEVLQNQLYDQNSPSHQKNPNHNKSDKFQNKSATDKLAKIKNNLQMKVGNYRKEKAKNDSVSHARLNMDTSWLTNMQTNNISHSNNSKSRFSTNHYRNTHRNVCVNPDEDSQEPINHPQTQNHKNQPISRNRKNNWFSSIKKHPPNSPYVPPLSNTKNPYMKPTTHKSKSHSRSKSRKLKKMKGNKNSEESVCSSSNKNSNYYQHIRQNTSPDIKKQSFESPISLTPTLKLKGKHESILISSEGNLNALKRGGSGLKKLQKLDSQGEESNSIVGYLKNSKNRKIVDDNTINEYKNLIKKLSDNYENPGKKAAN